MADEDKKKSFWETLPGIFTAAGAFLGGVAAVIAAMNGGGKDSAKTETTPPAQAAQPPSVNDEAARRAKTEAEAAKAEAERLKAEAAEAKAKAAELERKLAEAEQKKAASSVLKQGDITVDSFTGMRLAYVPGNCFMMGSSTDDKDHQDDEGPVHEVCVDSFWMGQYEKSPKGSGRRSWVQILPSSKKATTIRWRVFLGMMYKASLKS